MSYRYLIVDGEGTDSLGQQYLNLCHFFSETRDELNKIMKTNTSLIKLFANDTLDKLAQFKLFHYDRIKSIVDGINRDIHILYTKDHDRSLIRTNELEIFKYHHEFVYSEASITVINDFINKNIYLISEQFVDEQRSEKDIDDVIQFIDEQRSGKNIDEVIQFIDENKIKKYEEKGLISVINSYLNTLFKYYHIFPKDKLKKNAYDYQIEDVVNLIKANLFDGYKSNINPVIIKNILLNNRDTSINKQINGYKEFKIWWTDEKDLMVSIQEVIQPIHDYGQLPFNHNDIQKITSYARLKEIYVQLNYIISRRIMIENPIRGTLISLLEEFMNNSLKQNGETIGQHIYDRYIYLEQIYKTNNEFIVHGGINVYVLYNTDTNKIHKRFDTPNDLQNEKLIIEKLWENLSENGRGFVLFPDEVIDSDLIMQFLPNYLVLDNSVSLP